MHASNSIIKFADDTTVVGLITNNDETANREEVRAIRVWCLENNLSHSRSTKQRRDCGLQDTAEGAPPYPYRRDSSGEGGKLQVPRRTHHRQTEMFHPHRQCGEERVTAPLQPQEAEEKPVETFTDAELRASCRAVSPPSMATAPAKTTGFSKGWCGLHNASPRANYLPSRTPTTPDVTGRPKRSSRTTTTRATACLPNFHPEGEVSTGTSKLGQRG